MGYRVYTTKDKQLDRLIATIEITGGPALSSVPTPPLRTSPPTCSGLMGAMCLSHKRPFLRHRSGGAKPIPPAVAKPLSEATCHNGRSLPPSEPAGELPHSAFSFSSITDNSGAASVLIHALPLM
jgi:hypothetical protein